MYVPWGKTLIFLSPLGSLKFLDFLSSLFILKLSCSKPIRNILNYASTVNIEEVTKFYNLGNKTFETDFKISSCSNKDSKKDYAALLLRRLTAL